VKRIVLLGVAVALLWFVWRQEKAAAPSASSVADVQAPPAHVRTLANASERQQISDRIAHAHSVPAQPSLPPAEPEPASPELPKETVRSAMREVVMHLLDCYESASPLEPLRAVANRMAERGLTRMPVVDTDASSAFVGMISLRDLLHARAKNVRDEHHQERVLHLRFLGRTA